MYCVKLHKSTNLKMCLRLTEMYSKVIHSQRILYHTVRIQRHHHHKEHSEVKKQSILSYPLEGGGIDGTLFFCKIIGRCAFVSLSFMHFFMFRFLSWTISCRLRNITIYGSRHTILFYFQFNLMDSQ